MFRKVALFIFGWFALATVCFAQTPQSPFRAFGQKIQQFNPATNQYENFLIKGVNYSPYPVGTWPDQYGNLWIWYNNQAINLGILIYSIDYTMDRDFPAIAILGSNNGINPGPNTVRTFTQLIPLGYGSGIQAQPPSLMLAKAAQYGLKVMAGYGIPFGGIDFGNGGIRYHFVSEFRNYVWNLQNDPYSHEVVAIGLTNENNAHLCDNIPNCNLALQQTNFFSLLNEMAYYAKCTPGTGNGFAVPCIVNPQTPPPIVVVLDGNINDMMNFDAAIPSVDAWGMNVYRGASFTIPANGSQPAQNFFVQAQSITNKPVIITEFGVDAFNNVTQTYDPTTQASVDGQLWDQLYADYLNVANDPTVGATAGGMVFEWSDEWWKPASAAFAHETLGFSNPLFPDGFANEEWWGIVAPLTPANNYGDPNQVNWLIPAGNFLDVIDYYSAIPGYPCSSGYCYPNGSVRPVVWDLHARW